MVVEKGIRCTGQGKRATPDVAAAMVCHSALLTFLARVSEVGKMIRSELRGD
jgi:hypothetical protein